MTVCVCVSKMSCLQLQLLNLDERIANLRRPLLWTIEDKNKQKQQQQQQQQNYETRLTNGNSRRLLVVNNLRDDCQRYENTEK